MTTMSASLGMNSETGTCLRHPSVQIRLGTLSQCHYATCRLCASDLIAKETRLKDPLNTAQNGNHHHGTIDGVAQLQSLPSNHEDDEDEPGDEDILDDDDDEDQSELTTNKPQENDSHDQTMASRLQLAVLRASQFHALTIVEKDELILSLQRQVATQDERILVLQATVDKQQKTITQELKAIKAIAKKRAIIRRNSMETSTTSSTNETPSEQPPKLPGRKPSEPWNIIGVNANTKSGLQADSGSSPSTTSASSLPSLPQIPPPTNSATAKFFNKRPGPSLNNGPNSTPPALPQRMESVDTMTLSYNTYESVDDSYRRDSLDTENAKIYASSNFSSLTSGAEATSSWLTTQSQSVGASQYSQFLSSAVTIDTFTDLQKPPQRKLSARPDSTDAINMETVSRGNSYSTGFSSKTDEISINDKGDDQSLEDPFHVASDQSQNHQQQQQEQQSQQSQEIAFVPSKHEISFVPPPPSYQETPPSLRASKSIPVPSRQSLPFDGHATAPVGSFQHEIEFDATATFLHHHHPHQQPQHQPKSSHMRTSIAQVRFDESQQLLLEASQALHTTGIPTPSSVKLRKSLTKKSMPPEKQQQRQQQHEYGRSASNPSIITRPRSQSKEIEFSVSPEPQKAKSVLERHLEGRSKSTNLGESMHNKTEEQIIQEKIYGKAAVASAEDEANDEYDYFDGTGGNMDLPFTTKGYLEYSKDLNLSPVSCLTTLSSLRDNSQIEANANEEEGTGPRKALHSAGVAIRLPMEDGFDSDDDDEDDQQRRGGDGQQSTQDFSTGGNGDSKSNSNANTTTSSNNSNNNDPEKIATDNSKSSSSKYSDSMPVYEASQRSLRTNSRDLPKSTSPFSQSTKRNTAKSVLRVDNDTVQDKYGDEGKYTGTIATDSRLPHGYGQMKYDNARQYDGEWKGGRWHGYGRWVNPNGDCYEGTFDYDARHGRGIYTWKNGNVYRGEFFHDKRQGKGAFHFANGNIYEGDFINGVFEGQGRYKFDGGSYEGEWKNGRYHGKGILIFTDGSSYTGEFLDGVAHGQGEEKGADGTIRKGIWEHGKPQAVR